MYLIVQSLLRLKKLDGWFPPTAQMIMLWMFFGNMVLGLLNEFRQSFDLLGVVLYDGQQEFSWASNFPQSIEMFERFTFFNGDGRSAMCVEMVRAYLSHFDFFDFDNNPMAEPGTNFTLRDSRQVRLMNRGNGWLAWMLLDVFKLMVLETLHYVPLLFANLIYINIVRASNSFKKASKGLGCLACTVYTCLVLRVLVTVWSLSTTYTALAESGKHRHDRVYSYEHPYYVLLIQWFTDQIGLSTVIFAWGMLVSMMIPKEKRSLPLKILIRSLIPFTSFVLALYLFGFAAGQEKEGGWNSHESEYDDRFRSSSYLLWLRFMLGLGIDRGMHCCVR